MPKSNFERLIQLAEEVFAVKSDPNQLDVNEEVRERLYKIHPWCISQHTDENGPVAWLLIFPTTNELMQKFLEGKINEKEMFYLTPLNVRYDSIYLCSALVLEEYRRKGIIKNLAIKAISNIRKEHEIKSMFVWAFSEEGRMAAQHMANLISLPLYFKK